LQYGILKYCVSKFSAVKNFLHSIILYNFSKVSDFIACSILIFHKNCFHSKNAGVTGKMTPAFCIVAGSRGILERSRGILERRRGILERSRGILERSRGILEHSRGILERSRGILERSRGILEHSHGILERGFYNKTMYFQYFNIFHKLNLI
jgi:hypothetical protein